MRHAEVEGRRRTRGESALLFLTDRCPVGCAHCSVDSRPDSPRITDFARFGAVLEALCESDLTLVGISGGEPFVERRALSLATERLAAAGKEIVLYTSGFWATGRQPPQWVRPVLRRCCAVVLSTDAFHQAALADERFTAAAAAVAAEDVWIIVQVLDRPDMVARATGLLVRAFGPEWTERAELVTVPPLPYGRAADLFRRVHRWPATEFRQPCRAVHAPVVRYDGVVSACCNEAVLMGRGPAGLRRTGRTPDEVTAALAHFRELPLLRAVGSTGPGPLTALPALADLATEQVGSICELCWKMVDRLDGAAPDRLLDAVAALDPVAT